jgi:hypothetical protein
MFAKLEIPQQVFGRPGRHKFHRYGVSDAKTQDKPKKKTKTGMSPKTAKGARTMKPKKSVRFQQQVIMDASPIADSSTSTSIDEGSRAQTENHHLALGSIFGDG